VLFRLSDVLSPEVAARLCSMSNDANVRTTQDMAATVTQALWSHPLFVLAVHPKRLSQPVFRRYDEGMESGGAVADALNGGNNGIRADVGVIVFLSEPLSYDGGELVLDTGFGDEKIKAGAGECVIYAASARRGVALLTRGTRWTAECCAQSLIRHSAQREILYDIGYSLHLLELFGPTRRAEVDQLRACQQNLLRLWAEA
jgi:PKHD-type hydroxylase